MKSHLVDFTDRKLSLAVRLTDGAEGGSYGDGILIISSLLAACASQLWPGERIDKYRFVEIWTRYTNPNTGRNLVSVPLLIQELQEQNASSAADALAASNPKLLSSVPGIINDHVITGPDVDLDEREIRRLCPSLDVELLRDHSYAAIFYKQVRSAYVHEYRAGDSASAHRMASNEYVVSYTNTLPAPHRRIHFPILWLTDVTRSVVEAVEPIWGSAPLPLPTQWWLRGANPPLV
jgi:hypothetical protein